MNPKRPGERQEWAILWGCELELSSAERAVLVYLAHRWNYKRKIAFPSLDRIAQDTGFHRSTVIRSVAKLAEDGLITKNHPKQRRRDTGGQFATEYSINFDKAPQSHGATTYNNDHGRICQNQGRPVPGPQSHGATPTGYLTGRDNQHSDSTEPVSESVAPNRYGNNDEIVGLFDIGEQAMGEGNGALISKLIRIRGNDVARELLVEAAKCQDHDKARIRVKREIEIN
ncbi:helix-turn-helix domain-containing protein [Marinihelvus fidelis]|uniref:Helix-turn-helix domain-containing protein n=1 Tax=Marinihelvus fidelis TaxID=2613842 RepID=A0A5N0TIQ4_9GAMM|nr:helix-turn-helix domain-containing protein [Marinihelvus fidelis]KAA9133169.1 helix-turn-helix domain-containing protein [Marinihelvus fidelis]